MINDSYETFFGTLANENRLLIIHYLADNGPQNVTQISKGTRLEQSSVSRNLNRLLTCQFVHIKPAGKERVYSLNGETIKPLLKLIDKHTEKYCDKSCENCVGHVPSLEKVSNMKATTSISSKQLHKCTDCGLHYKDAKQAKDCYAFCIKNRACSLEITRHSVEHIELMEKRKLASKS